jgi:hypothetical protein
MNQSMRNLKSITICFALLVLTFNAGAQVTNSSCFEPEFLESLNTSIESMPFEREHNIKSNFQEGAAIFKSDKKYGIINKQGYEICGPVYDEIHLFNHGYAAVKRHNKWTFVNKQGNQLTPLRYDWVGSFENNMAAVLYEGKWGLLNEQGYEVVPTIYDAVKVEKTGEVWVKENGSWQPYNLKTIEFQDLI